MRRLLVALACVLFLDSIGLAAGYFEISTTTGQTLYGIVFNAADGNVWNTAGVPAFGAWNAANITDYDVAMAEVGVGGCHYRGTFPAGITTAGTYTVQIRVRAGVTPAVGDAVLGTCSMLWDGTAEIDWSDLHTDIAALGTTIGSYTIPGLNMTVNQLYQALMGKR